MSKSQGTGFKPPPQPPETGSTASFPPRLDFRSPPKVPAELNSKPPFKAPSFPGDPTSGTLLKKSALPPGPKAAPDFKLPRQSQKVQSSGEPKRRSARNKNSANPNGSLFQRSNKVSERLKSAAKILDVKNAYSDSRESSLSLPSHSPSPPSSPVYSTAVFSSPLAHEHSSSISST